MRFFYYFKKRTEHVTGMDRDSSENITQTSQDQPIQELVSNQNELPEYSGMLTNVKEEEYLDPRTGILSSTISSDIGPTTNLEEPDALSSSEMYNIEELRNLDTDINKCENFNDNYETILNDISGCHESAYQVPASSITFACKTYPIMSAVGTTPSFSTSPLNVSPNATMVNMSTF